MAQYTPMWFTEPNYFYGNITISFNMAEHIHCRTDVLEEYT